MKTFEALLKEKKPFENIVGKGENAVLQHFLLFPKCFISNIKKCTLRAIMRLLSANVFNLDKVKILFSGKGIKEF